MVRVRHVSDVERGSPGVPLSDLDPTEKSRRAGSFGGVASHYERYRPGPPPAAVDWLLPEGARRVVDLGAGTGAMTRLLIDRVDEVVAVEPDARMRAVLEAAVPDARVLEGRGEAIPLPDDSADAVIASSSWHWMEPRSTLDEVARVLRPGGTLGAVWSGPDPDGAFLVQVQALLADQGERSEPAAGGAGATGALSDTVLGEARRPSTRLEIPHGFPFATPDHEVFGWDVALTADDLVGLLGTMSSIITMDDEARDAVLSEARRLLRELLGVEGEVTVDVAFRADAWRTHRDG
jgi:SAM-dependent methyltransferase